MSGAPRPTLFISARTAETKAQEALLLRPSLTRAVIQHTVRRNTDDRSVETGFVVRLYGTREALFL